MDLEALLDSLITVGINSHSRQYTMHLLELELSRPLNVKWNDTFRVSIYDFLFGFNSNIWFNSARLQAINKSVKSKSVRNLPSAPLEDIRLCNIKDLQFRRFRVTQGEI